MRRFLALVILLGIAVAAIGGSARAQQTVRFAALDGANGAAPTELVGYLFLPVGPGPHAAIVFMHGCGGLFARATGEIVARETAWRRSLVERGFAVLMVDGFGPRNTTEICSPASFKPGLYARRPGDAYAALLFLRSRPDISHDRIGLMGWSNGGGAVLMAVAERSSGRPANFTGPDFRAAVAFYPGSCSPQRLGPDWTTEIPLLILVGEDDVWTPAAPCQEQAEQAAHLGAPVVFHAYPGAHHDFDWPGLKRRELPAFTMRSGVVPIVAEDPAARADALDRVGAFLARHMSN
ncbi:MAG: dienelactone hydrolase [Alphaproteobacteria bacterium]|nr:dienelactone hydrolase [Alphaproteobacteria bacterium]